jgi:hypothetical protein
LINIGNDPAILICNKIETPFSIEGGYRLESPPSPPYKNANIDTVSIGISVLILCKKARKYEIFYTFSLFSAFCMLILLI